MDYRQSRSYTIEKSWKILQSILLLLCLGLFSCSGMRYLSDKESFYSGCAVKLNPHGKIRDKKSIRKNLTEMVSLKPNLVILGARPGVWLYHIAGEPNKKKGFRYFIKYKLGHAPVLLGDVHPAQTATLLSGNLNNKGYFRSTADYMIKTKDKKSSITYNVELYPPYHISDIHYPSPKDSSYFQILKIIKNQSLLKIGDRYDLSKLKAEQERIERLVEDFGMYYFDDRYLIYEADTTVGSRQVDLTLKLEKGIPPEAKTIYRLNKVTIISNYTLSKDTVRYDTLHIDGYDYVDGFHKFKPHIIIDAVNLIPGDIYTRTERDLTLSHMVSLGVFKFANIEYVPSVKRANMLNATVYLTPYKKKSIRTDLQAVSKSNNFMGPHLSVTFTNRNALRGAELLDITLNGGYEIQVGQQQSPALNTLDLGGEAGLTIPRFVTPFPIRFTSRKYLPSTFMKMEVNTQQRVNYFRMNAFNVRYGYSWRETISKSHELTPVTIDYFKLGHTSAIFDRLLTDNPVLAGSFQNQFVVGSAYAFTWNTRLPGGGQTQYLLDEEQPMPQQWSFYFRGNVSVAGNLLHLLQGKLSEATDSSYTIFHSPYSQFTEGDIDFRTYWSFDRHNTIALRLLAGAGFAYGNSTTLPYLKQFSVGGANSLRAFPARSVGPGTYNIRTDPNVNTKIFFVDQRGELKLEGNLEYRFDIIKILKGALFVDAGNVWMRHPDPDRPGAEFVADNFISQLAVGSGAGLRFDFSFFVLRFDLGFPVRRPDLPEGDRWVLNKVDFGDRSWRRDNLLLNIAIGYPF